MCKTAQGILLGTQFELFIPEVVEPTQPSTDVQSSPPPDIHLEEIDMTYSHEGAGSSHYKSPTFLDRHIVASYNHKRCNRRSQLERVQEGDEH